MCLIHFHSAEYQRNTYVAYSISVNIVAYNKTVNQFLCLVHWTIRLYNEMQHIWAICNLHCVLENDFVAWIYVCWKFIEFARKLISFHSFHIPSSLIVSIFMCVLWHYSQLRIPLAYYIKLCSSSYTVQSSFISCDHHWWIWINNPWCMNGMEPPLCHELMPNWKLLCLCVEFIAHNSYEYCI